MSTRESAVHVEPPAVARWGDSDPLVSLLLAGDFLLFAGGAAAHLGLAIPLGAGAWDEPVVVPAAIVEGTSAVLLAIALIARLTSRSWADRFARWALWVCFAGVMLGMARLAVGSIPEARTRSNDFAHIGMTVLNTVALVRLAGRRSS